MPAAVQLCSRFRSCSKIAWWQKGRTKTGLLEVGIARLCCSTSILAIISFWIPPASASTDASIDLPFGQQHHTSELFRLGLYPLHHKAYPAWLSRVKFRYSNPTNKSSRDGLNWLARPRMLHPYLPDSDHIESSEEMTVKLVAFIIQINSRQNHKRPIN